jgi:hypothetical protein
VSICTSIKKIRSRPANISSKRANARKVKHASIGTSIQQSIKELRIVPTMIEVFADWAYNVSLIMCLEEYAKITSTVSAQKARNVTWFM